MSKRKLNNVTQRTDGRWMARKAFGYTTEGKPNRKTFYGDTAAEAAQKLTDYERQLENGLNVDAENVTFDKWLLLWLHEYKFRTVRPQTFDSYEGYANSRIIPALGRYKLRALRPEHFQQFINGLQTGENLSKATLVKLKNIMSGALSQAVKNGLITRNPADSITLPKGTKRKIHAFTLDEQRALLSSVKGHRLYALFVTALGAGLRRGELLALRWSDINLDAQEISVVSTVSRSKDRDKDGNVADRKTKSSLKVGDAKTDTGFRVVPLTDEVCDALKEHKKNQAAERLHAGAAYSNNDLVFCTELGGYLEPRNVTRLFEAKRALFGVSPWPFHSLRHSFATNAITAGMDYYYLSRIMGHSKISVTLDTYADYMPDKSRAEMLKMQGVLLLEMA